MNKTNSRQEECCLNTLEKVCKIFLKLAKLSTENRGCFFLFVTQVPAANNSNFLNIAAFIFFILLYPLAFLFTEVKLFHCVLNSKVDELRKKNNRIVCRKEEKPESGDRVKL